jgi:hypothetical protein
VLSRQRNPTPSWAIQHHATDLRVRLKANFDQVDAPLREIASLRSQ